MITQKTVSIKSIVAKVYRDLNLQEEERFLDIFEWCGEALQHINVGLEAYHHDPICVDIDCYQGMLPEDVYLVTYVTHNNTALKPITGFKSHIDVYQGYEVIGPYIRTTFKEGEIKVFYDAYPVDSEGFPLIPDDISFKEALYRYCIMKLKYPDYLNGKVGQSMYTDMCTKWEDYCAQASSKAKMPGLGSMENIKNGTLRLIPKLYSFSNFFNDIGNPQYLKK